MPDAQNGARPLVTIVTPCVDEVRYIEEAIQSVRNQSYPCIEHLVIDGGSTDGTLDILRRHEDFLRCVSEPDAGQAHAINKGFTLAKGKIFAWLNADDLYAPDAVASVVAYFKSNPQAQFVYGDAVAIDEKRRRYGRRMNVMPGALSELVHETDFIVQPAAFWCAALWRAIGPLNESLHYTMDYDLWIRAAQKTSLHYVNRPLAEERIHPATKSFNGGVERIEELTRMIARHGGKKLPRAFSAEAASVYFMRGIKRVSRGSLREGSADLGEAWRLSSSIWKTSLYLATALLFGRCWIPRARLIANYVRSRFPRDVFDSGAHRLVDER